MSFVRDLELSRRDLLVTTASAAVAAGLPGLAAAQTPTVVGAPVVSGVSFRVNGEERRIDLDLRTTLLDTLREHLHLTGTKKGCDHGQCGACTVMVNGERVYSCLTLAVMNEGAEITTIEGLGTPDAMHAMQDAFVRHDGYQCGYCTPGQICSAVAVLDEIASGVPSHASADLLVPVAVTPEEIRERMSGNICRCGAYANIVDAMIDVAENQA
ncbi:aldehyde dehydrogenase iron-sulfur subunit [Aureimonas altamirensis]|uniref:aldehyde dehydrogenase iron-sulfur subunit PaoA n=1 Tax=Aureimonas altamirensis TaxID=370622 RepID=UPI001E632CC8|nr:aldehyde dehydrogenase iron-sulfur subunit PaoA [Aureimonas altamirensis]UHD46415.1 aldehyde dehydrogenase iron-sulfur subunit [Aureimonas altamirensis]